MIISIDVGIKNLAYIIHDNNKIIEWKVVELCPKGTNASKANLIDIGIEVYKAFENITHSIDNVVIENQIGMNAIRMKTIQGMITMFFISKGVESGQIQYWNALNKLKRFVKGKTSYTQRKKYSIAITRLLIQEIYPEHIEYFETHKKKDDLADCFLQLLDFLVKREELNEDIFSNAINLKL